ncbi:vitamin K epoxide reductase family protein [Nocardia tengchongensis]|uniref:vitamin K epoxide reductase family protein n=1 Tax=Nocardia tengchongensis TaxID=2055889 RepID=UPI0033E0F151
MISAGPRSAWPLLLAALIGWGASVTLLVEKFKSLTEPGYRPSCTIDSTLSCTTVMADKTASLFGFPNPIIGVVGFSVFVTIGVLLVCGISLPRWFVGGMWAGLLAGVAAIGWLVWDATFRIHALCPWCMVVWAVTPAMFAIVTGLLFGRSRGVAQIVAEWRWTLVAIAYAVIILIVYIQFQSYWNDKF